MKLENLILEEETIDGVLLVHAQGEIDHWTAPSLSERLRAAAHGEDGPVVVDLCDVTLIDSAGVSVLVNAARRLVHQRRRMSIVCPPGNLLRLFQLTGLVDALEIHPTRDEALGAVAEA
ncbi:MAG: anti-sigma factor antagonist [Thermoleophilaceae bacterium]|nr:anti-sigma factor antagonist [Thermoleophilaceae bacterium]